MKLNDDGTNIFSDFHTHNIGKSQLSGDDISLLQELEKKNKIDYNDSFVSEFLKCRNNIFYFIYNYCNIGEVGNPRLYTPDMMSRKYRRVIKSINRYKKAILMASRQLGKSTLAACISAHAITFFPGIKVAMFNMDMGAGVENIRKVKFVLENLPAWMRFIPEKSTTKTYIELTNGSTIFVYYPSTIKSPDQLARSLTIPCLYVDEAAFIPHIDRIWTSAQPTLSTASEQAAKYGYPTWSILTSTPNGTEGRGKFFFDYWTGAIDSELIFEIDKDHTKENETNENLIYEKFTKNADEIINTPGTNGFVQVYHHWSEDPRKGPEWYEQQCRDYNYNKRKIAQEYDIRFVGSTNNPFDDDVLEKLQEAVLNPIGFLDLPHATKLKFFKDIDPTDYFLIGVDTASSIDNCYSAIEVFSYKNFEQVAELAIRLGSLKQYAEIVMKTAEYFIEKTGGRVILCVENNSIGKAIVEELVETDLIVYMYHDKSKVDSNGIVTEWGIATTGKTKPIMVAEAYSHINEHPETFHSQDLVNQLNSIERNNAGQVTSSSYTDMFMATCFCAYVRKMRELDILPLLRFNESEIQEKNYLAVKTLIGAVSPRIYANEQNAKEELLLNSGVMEDKPFQNPEDEEIFHLPFFYK